MCGGAPSPCRRELADLHGMSRLASCRLTCRRLSRWVGWRAGSRRRLVGRGERSVRCRFCYRCVNDVYTLFVERLHCWSLIMDFAGYKKVICRVPRSCAVAQSSYPDIPVHLYDFSSRVTACTVFYVCGKACSSIASPVLISDLLACASRSAAGFADANMCGLEISILT